MRALRVQPATISSQSLTKRKEADEKKAAMERANKTMCELAEVLTLSSKALEDCDADLTDLIPIG